MDIKPVKNISFKRTKNTIATLRLLDDFLLKLINIGRYHYFIASFTNKNNI